MFCADTLSLRRQIADKVFRNIPKVFSQDAEELVLSNLQATVGESATVLLLEAREK